MAGIAIVPDRVGHLLHRLNQAQGNSPRPYLPALTALLSLAAACHTADGGPGYGFGSGSLREPEVGAVPGERSSSHILDDDLDRLAPFFTGAVVGRNAERGLLHRRRTPGAPLHTAIAQHVDGRHLLGDPGRMDEAERHQRDPEAEPMCS